MPNDDFTNVRPIGGDEFSNVRPIGASQRPSATIGPSKPSVVTDPENKAASSGFMAPDIEHYTQEGRQEHPVLSRVGDLISASRELLAGGQETGKPMGTSSGVINNPVTNMMAIAPDAAGLAGTVESGIKGLSGMSIRGMARKALLDPITKEPTLTPSSITKRVLRTPEEIGEARAQELAGKMSETETARQKELSDMERLRNQDAQSRMIRGRQQETLDQKAMQPGPSVPLTESPYYTQNQSMSSFSEGKPGPFNRLSESPNMPVRRDQFGLAINPEEGTVGSQVEGGGQDLISRMKKVVRPGEEPSVEDLKRAGDLTQAPFGRLKTLASWGDKLAKNEINRRLRNQ